MKAKYRPFANFEALHTAAGLLNVIVETPKGNRNKFKTERNDRLIAVAAASQDRKFLDLEHLSPSLVMEIEHFFVSYNQMEGKALNPLGRLGPAQAQKLADKATKRFRKQMQ